MLDASPVVTTISVRVATLPITEVVQGTQSFQNTISLPTSIFLCISLNLPLTNLTFGIRRIISNKLEQTKILKQVELINTAIFVVAQTCHHVNEPQAPIEKWVLSRSWWILSLWIGVWIGKLLRQEFWSRKKIGPREYVRYVEALQDHSRERNRKFYFLLVQWKASEWFSDSIRFTYTNLGAIESPYALQRTGCVSDYSSRYHYDPRHQARCVLLLSVNWRSSKNKSGWEIRFHHSTGNSVQSSEINNTGYQGLCKGWHHQCRPHIVLPRHGQHGNSPV